MLCIIHVLLNARQEENKVQSSSREYELTLYSMLSALKSLSLFSVRVVQSIRLCYIRECEMRRQQKLMFLQSVALNSEKQIIRRRTLEFSF